MTPQELAWPYWMRRYICIGSDEAFDDLMCSVGVSPPYGNVKGDEADAVYALLEVHRGPGAAGEAAYSAVREIVGDDSERTLTLDVFSVHDRIASDPALFSVDDVKAGAGLAEKLDDDGLRAYFGLLAAELAYRDGDLEAAQAECAGAFLWLGRLAQGDAAYVVPLGKAAANGSIFAALNGDLRAARTYAALALRTGHREHLKTLLPALETPRPDATTVAAAGVRAGDLLEAGKALQALEWFRHAESMATASGEEEELCGLLGDMAVAYRRVGNSGAAMATYRRAIALCRHYHDDLNLSRWCGNLGSLLTSTGDRAAARALLEEAAAAAERTGQAQQNAVAQGHLAVLLQAEGRIGEAVQKMARAQDGADAPTGDLWRRHELELQLAASRAARERHETQVALQAVDAGLALVRGSGLDEQRIAAQLWVERALAQEAQNDIAGAAAALEEAADRFAAAGDGETALLMRETAQRYEV